MTLNLLNPSSKSSTKYSNLISKRTLAVAMVVEKAHGILFRTPQPETLAFFNSTPWCADLIADPTFRAFDAPSRQQKASLEDNFTAKTLATAETIPGWQAFYRKSGSTAHDTDHPSLGEVCVLLAVQSGTDGHPHIAHGGLVATLLDEVMTLLARFHTSPGTSGYTAFIRVDYKNPVTTPCIILARALLESRSQGKKAWLRGSLEDGQGRILATAETLVLEVADTASKL